MRAAAGTVLAAVCLAGCSGLSDAAPSSAPTPTASSSGATTAPSPTGTEGPGHSECDPATRDGVAATISGQQRSFADGDFDAAWQFASSGFRSGVDADGLRAIIEDGYALLTEQAELSFGACAALSPGSAAIAVDARGPSGSQARYLYVLAFEGDRWLVDRVSALASGDDPDEAVAA